MGGCIAASGPHNRRIGKPVPKSLANYLAANSPWQRADEEDARKEGDGGERADAQRTCARRIGAERAGDALSITHAVHRSELAEH